MIIANLCKLIRAFSSLVKKIFGTLSFFLWTMALEKAPECLKKPPIPLTEIMRHA